MKTISVIFLFSFFSINIFAKIEYMAAGYGHTCAASKSKVACLGNESFEKEFKAIENLVAGAVK